MTPSKVSVLAALVSALLTAGVLHHFQSGRARETALLRDANNRLRYSANQRRQAATAAVAPNAAGTSGATVGAGAPARASVPGVPPPSAGDYRAEGNATPVAALQTLAWSSDRGDPAAVEKLLCFDPVARTKAEAFLAMLPASVRSSWRNVDEMAAALLTSDGINHPFPTATVLAKAGVEPLGETRVRLRLPGTPKDGLEFQQSADGWRRVITEAMVDAYIRDNTLPAQPGR